jgi:hypothetical protein
MITGLFFLRLILLGVWAREMRFGNKIACFFLLLLAWAGLVCPAFAEKRVALVVGNSNYAHVAHLNNPENDAQDLSVTLRTLGFDVIYKINVDQRGLVSALEEFERKAIGADSALFFFAGHGLQHKGQNYLLPIDAEIEDEVSLKYNALAIDRVRDALEPASGVKIMILDACRNNPISDRLAVRSAGLTRSTSMTRGLARLDRTEGMVVAYATQADEVAQDGNGRNSPFSAALNRRLAEPNLEIATLFRRVAQDVYEQTGGKQRPELSISLLQDYYLNLRDDDSRVWRRLGPDASEAELRDFVARFPTSPFVRDAQNRIYVIEAARHEEELRQRQQRLEDQLAVLRKREEDRLAAEQAEKERRDKERQDMERQAVLRQEFERKQAEERDAHQKEVEAREQARLEQERQEAARQAAEGEAAARKAAEELEKQRQAAEKAEQERQAAAKAAAEEAERQRQLAAKEAAVREAAARRAVEELEKQRVAAEKAEQERQLRAKAEAEAAERKRQEDARLAAAREEAARKAADEQEKNRLAAEKAEQDRRAAAQAAAEEAERKRQEAERKEAARIEKEKVAAAERERLRLEVERVAAEEKEKARLAKEKQEAEAAEAKRIAAQKAEAERIEKERVKLAALEEENRRTAEAEAEKQRQAEICSKDNAALSRLTDEKKVDGLNKLKGETQCPGLAKTIDQALTRILKAQEQACRDENRALRKIAESDFAGLKTFSTSATCDAAKRIADEKIAKLEAANARMATACAAESEQFDGLKKKLEAKEPVIDDLKAFQTKLTCDKLRGSVAEAVKLATPAVDTAEQVKAAEVELERIGCYAGPNDGALNNHVKASLSDYYKVKGLSSRDVKFDDALLEELKGELVTVCKPQEPAIVEKPHRRAPVEVERPQKHPSVARHHIEENAEPMVRPKKPAAVERPQPAHRAEPKAAARRASPPPGPSAGAGSHGGGGGISGVGF